MTAASMQKGGEHLHLMMPDFEPHWPLQASQQGHAKETDQS